MNPGADQTLTAEPPSARAASLPTRLVAGEVLGERYRIEAEIGRGGRGVVYRAFDAAAGAFVAVKLLEGGPWAEVRATLFRELRFGRSIQHPNVCRIHDVFETPQGCILVMELAGAGTLRTTLGQLGGDRLPEDKLTDARAVVAGLAAIHAAGLVHRDLKPENVLRRSDGRLVVSDFGLTRELDRTAVSTRLAGTPGYLAPETLLHGRTTQASDVWSLGVVLHELLTGQRPIFRPRTGRPQLTARPRDPRERALHDLCARCLHPDPGRRPGCDEVQALLRPGNRSRRRAAPLALGLLLVSALAVAAPLLRRTTRVCTAGAGRCQPGGVATCRADGSGYDDVRPCAGGCLAGACVPDISGVWEDFFADGRFRGNTIHIRFIQDRAVGAYYLDGPLKGQYRPFTFFERNRLRFDYFPDEGRIDGDADGIPMIIDLGPRFGIWRRVPYTRPGEGPPPDPNYRPRTIDQLPG
jgi:hypothetical protein